MKTLKTCNRHCEKSFVCLQSLLFVCKTLAYILRGSAEQCFGFAAKFARERDKIKKAVGPLHEDDDDDDDVDDDDDDDYDESQE